jgi:hypothetical protein
MARQTICNWCGKTMTSVDKMGGVDLHTTIGYGTTLDGESLDFDCCPECLEEFLKTMNSLCKIPVYIPSKF